VATIRETALFERGAALSSGCSAPRILVHLAHPALIARHDRRAPFAARRPQRGAGQRERQRPRRPRQGAQLDAVAVPAPRVVALVAPGPERDRQLFVHRRLDRDPDLGMNQLAQRGRPILRQPLRLLDTLRHGAFLRRPSCRTAGWWLDFPPEECAISLFSTPLGTPPRSAYGFSPLK